MPSVFEEVTATVEPEPQMSAEPEEKKPEKPKEPDLRKLRRMQRMYVQREARLYAD